MFIALKSPEICTPLGVRCACGDGCSSILIGYIKVSCAEHRTPKGVPNRPTLENYKHVTPPEWKHSPAFFQFP